MYSIRQINIPKESNDYFVTSEFEKKVSLWSVKKKSKIMEIETLLDSGGRRLALVPTESPIIITGAYNRYGISAYNVEGEKLWQRKDLKKVQFIISLKIDGEYCVGAGFDDKPFVILNIHSGETIISYKGIRRIYPNKDDTLWLTKSYKEVKLIDVKSEVNLWSKNADVYSVAYSDELILLNTRSSLKSYNLRGEERWSYDCSENHIIHDISWDVKRQRWMFILWNHINGGPKYLCKMDKKGTVISKKELGEIWEYQFSGDGQFLITSGGELLDTNDLNVKWKFCDKLLN